MVSPKILQASDEPVASRTRSQTTASEPIGARTRQALGSSPEMSAFADVKDDKTLNEWLHEIAFVTSTMSDPDEPQSFQDAWCRWVFKVKRNGVYHARLVAKGFSQISDVDFTDNYSPVVNDVTFRVVVARMIIEKLKGKVVDIDNAFLNRDLEHEIYMKIPEGYDEVINKDVDKEDCLILQKAIYGLVQAARLQHAWISLTQLETSFLHLGIIIYIDDMLIIGKEEAIDDAIKVLQGHFSSEGSNKFGRLFRSSNCTK